MEETVVDTVNSVGTMASILNEYGPVIGILSVFLLIFIIVIFGILRSNQKYINSIITQQEQQNEAIMNQNNKFVDNMIDNDNNKYQNNNQETSDTKHKDFIKTYVDIQTIFKSAAKYVQTDINADRIGIYVFHNGNRTPYGLPFYKMSCVGEWLKSNFHAKKSIHSELPLHVFDDFVTGLYTDGYFENITNSDKSIDQIATFSANNCIIYIYILGIYDKHDALAGFSVAEFYKIPEDVSLNEIKNAMKQLNEDVTPVIINTHLQDKLKHSGDK